MPYAASANQCDGCNGMRCACRKSGPAVLVMQSAQIGRHRMRPAAWTARGIGASLFSDKCVRASLKYSMYDSSTCRRCCSPSTTTWSTHSRRIEPIQPFGIGILPRRSRRGRSILDAHRPNTPGEYLAIGTIPVVDEVLWSPLPPACLSELTSDPLGGRVRGGPQP